jgi:chromosome segregation ATPase
MDEQEMEKILYQLDERTKRVDESIDRIEAKAEENSNDIDNLEEKVSRNSTVLGGITTAAGGVLIWVSDKVARFF